MKNLVRIFYFGNIFNGLCAVAMCIESNLLQGLTLNYFPFYLLIFFGSWVYYTMIYVRSTLARANNEINTWYRANLANIKLLLWIVAFVMAVFAAYFIATQYQSLLHLSAWQWFLLASVPAGGALYTFKLPLPFLKKFRQVGWLKPFIIGYTWAGWVTLFPVVIWQIQHTTTTVQLLPNPLFWLQNFLFVTILAIIFDVKDYKVDVRKELKTFPALLGIHNTYRYVVIPATLLNIVIVVWFQMEQHFTFAQVFIQLIPFALLLMEAFKKPRQQGILYYLVYIDGLMLLKALCGIISIQLF